jgi:dCMP deaminase
MKSSDVESEIKANKPTAHVIKHSVEKWDKHMLRIARECSKMSKDPSTKVGSVLMNNRKRIISTGYNGFAENTLDRLDWYSIRDIKYNLIIHAEENAILETVRNNLNITDGCTLYVYPMLPCDKCYQLIRSYNIKKIVSMKHSIENCNLCNILGKSQCMGVRWKSKWNNTLKMGKEDGVKFLLYE